MMWQEGLLIPFEVLEVDRRTIQLCDRIGVGSFGEVYSGTHHLLLSLFLFACMCDADSIVVDTNEH